MPVPDELSSSKMVPIAVAVVIVAPLVGLERVTAKVSLSSTVVSPWTPRRSSLLVSPGAKVYTLDRGNEEPPRKSRPLAGFVPVPVKDIVTAFVPVVLPVRVIVKVKAVVPVFPSF